MHLIGQKILAILCMLIFPATEICAELCCQFIWEHLPQLSANFEPWMKYLSVLDMNQQYILKLILLRGITLFSTGIILWISCFIVNLLFMLHICPHASVTQKWWQNVSQNLSQWILVPLGGGRGGFMCGRHGAGLDWPEQKDNFSNNILLIFAALKIWSELCCHGITMKHLP